MSQESSTSSSSSRLLVLGIIAVVIVAGLTLAIMAISNSGERASSDEPVNVLADSNDECVVCHARNTPGIVEQYGHSTKAAAEVTCRDCHEVDADYPGAVEHEETYVLGSPTSAMCETCHENEVAQYNQSRHGLPAYVAYAGQEVLSEDLLDLYSSIPEGGYNDEKVRARNSLHAIEGAAITKFACESCHDIGKPAEDGSVGQCQDCHLRHEFSLEQARRPETCNACHIGPDHPQWEIYQESPHGIAYATDGHTWDWEAEPGTLDTTNFPAPTCATCHMSGFGPTATTHDVGDRLTWNLAAPISSRRPAWQDNMTRMQGVCSECHNSNFIETFYDDADRAVEQVNAWVIESDEIIQPLKDNGLLTAQPFDEPIDFVYFNLWHHWGRTAKFGVWMQGADYVQWHGAYEILHDRAELIEMVNEKLEEAGMEPIDPGPPGPIE
ncbi:multiheme c-type cytochrome [Candidatus Leptofilum sp.]|uniref:multiheme c-type cytochrome n=1 Tax=Candidatus Leptofilum sp. TaxID=3241576 RepID=UPI003B5964F3